MPIITMEIPYTLPLEALGLPDPDELRTSDHELAACYRSFVETLKPVDAGQALTVDPYQLSVPYNCPGTIADWYATFDSSDRAKLLLLSIFSRPLGPSALWPKDRPKLIDQEIMAIFGTGPSEVSPVHSGDVAPYGLDSVDGRRRARQVPEFARLARELPWREPVATLAAEFIGSIPGQCAYTSWQVARWSDEWAAVYTVGDAGPWEDYPFPFLLGFCLLDNLDSNLVTLLQGGFARHDMGFYLSYGQVSGDLPFAAYALSVPDGQEAPDATVIGWLQCLDAPTRDWICRHFDDPTELSNWAWQTVDEAQDEDPAADAVCSLGDAAADLARAVAVANRSADRPETQDDTSPNSKTELASR